ncbi:MAG: hypothetical protein KF873_04665 [Gemmataceae bacterium]|nr:hypothetical protein [Gemmataceae bacterium]
MSGADDNLTAEERHRFAATFAAGDVAFELRVTGYEFPDDTVGSANWLFVEGRVRHPRGDWRFRHPSLETHDVARLADWLEAVAAGTEPEPWCGFTEPNLSFEIAGAGAARVLRVGFAAESRPPWAEASGTQVEFPVAALDLASAVASLRQQLRLWPERPEVEEAEAEPGAAPDPAG